jgi:hypothetical protein
VTRHILQVSIASALVKAARDRVGAVNDLSVPELEARITQESMQDADAVITELQRLGMLKGVKG